MDTGSDQREELTGGVNSVVRVGGTVVRPMGPYSQAVHHVLAHLERVGFVGVPRLITTDIGLQTETVSFLDGEVADYPLPQTFTSDEAMRSAAVFLRRLHDALATFDIPRGIEWWLPPVEPADIVVHGDFAPYNCVVVDGRVTGVSVVVRASLRVLRPPATKPPGDAGAKQGARAHTRARQPKR